MNIAQYWSITAEQKNATIAFFLHNHHSLMGLLPDNLTKSISTLVTIRERLWKYQGGARVKDVWKIYLLFYTNKEEGLFLLGAT